MKLHKIVLTSLAAFKMIRNVSISSVLNSIKISSMISAETVLNFKSRMPSRRIESLSDARASYGNKLYL